VSPTAAGAGLTAGVDSGTQSVRVVVCDAAGAVVASAAAPHPAGCVQPPAAWWSALVAAFGSLDRALRAGVDAVAVGGQQHGCVPLGPAPSRAVLADARLWCDTSSAPEAARLNALADFSAEVGSRLVASFTITKLASMPAAAAAVCLPHDWLTWMLTGRLCTDRGDASGTGWWGPEQGVRRDLLELAGRSEIETPEVLGPDEIAGELQPGPAAELGLRPGIPVGPGTGDNMAAALGVGAAEGEVVVSLGTSGTVFALSPRQTHDASGLVAGFADATGRHLPLVCTLNCTTPLDLFASWFGLDVTAALDRADIPTELTMLPYLRGERTPDLPAARGLLHGLTDDSRPEELLAAAVHGAAAGLAAGVRALEDAGVPAPASILLVGGGSRHSTWRHAVADVTGVPVLCPEPGEYAARGMAAQARAVLDGTPIAQVAARWRPHTGEQTPPRPGRLLGVAHEALLRAGRELW
jgi:xylulokinase